MLNINSKRVNKYEIMNINICFFKRYELLEIKDFSCIVICK